MIDVKEFDSHRFSRYYTSLEPFFGRPKIKAYTMLILSLITMSFFGLFAIRPTLMTITNLNQQIKDATYVDQKLQEKINSLSEARVQYDALRPDLETISNALPKEINFPPFVKSLEVMATESGVTISSLSFQTINLSSSKSTPSATAKEIPVAFNFTITGEYPSLSSFVRLLAKFERLVTIENMGFSGSEKKGEKVDEKESLRLTLKGQTYYVR